MRPENPASQPAGAPLRRDRRATNEPVAPEQTDPVVATEAAGIRESGPKPKRKRRVWPWVVGILAFLLILAAVAGAFALAFWNEAKGVQAQLEEAKSDISRLSSQLSAGDEAAVEATAGRITTNVSQAAETVEGPMWGLAASIPFIGQNVDAVQRVTRAVDVLVTEALPPGMQFMAALDLDALTVEGGGINLEPFRQVQDSIPAISAAFTSAQEIMAPVDTASLLPAVVGPIEQIDDVIQDAAPALDLVNRYLPTLLDMAASGTTKTYLVLFQNNAEIRATGGNPAASMILTMTDGRLGYVDQASSATFYAAGTAGDVHTQLPPEVTGLYLPNFTRVSQDYTSTPDFPTTAQLFQDLWRATSGSSFDGVISIDPVVLSHMLAVAGPVTLDSGEQITAENAVKTLLSDSYERFPSGFESDIYFAEVAQKVFEHLTSASWDPLAMLDALELSAEEQRVNLSFIDPAAQALAVELGVDGGLATDTVAQTQVGIYLNNSSISKLDYHLTSAITATCDATARTMTTTMTLQNSITDDVRSNYTLGGRNEARGLPRTTMMLDVLFFAPPGASIVETVPARGDARNWDRSGVEKGNTALSRTVYVPKDATETVGFTVALPEGDLGPLNLRHTPTARDTAVTVDASCDGLFAAAP